MKTNPFFQFSDLLRKLRLPDAMFTILSSKQQVASTDQLSGERLVLVHRYTGRISDPHALKLKRRNCSFHSQAGQQTQTTQLVHVNLIVFTEKSFIQSSEQAFIKARIVTTVWQKHTRLSLPELPQVPAGLQRPAQAAWPTLRSASHQLTHTTLKSLDIPLPSSPAAAGTPAKLKQKYGLPMYLPVKKENAEEKVTLNERY